MKYDYGREVKRLGEFKLNLFRAVSLKMIENVLVCLEESGREKKGKMISLIVRAQGTKLCLYQGTLLSEPKCVEFHDRPDNLKFPVVHTTPPTEEGGKPAHTAEVIKMQFSDPNDATNFRQLLSDFFRESTPEGLPCSKPKPESASELPKH